MFISKNTHTCTIGMLLVKITIGMTQSKNGCLFNFPYPRDINVSWRYMYMYMYMYHGRGPHLIGYDKIDNANVVMYIQYMSIKSHHTVQ